MTPVEQIQLKIDRGMSRDDAIADVARAEYFRMIHEANLPDDEWEALQESRRAEYERPVLDWMEKKC